MIRAAAVLAVAAAACGRTEAAPEPAAARRDAGRALFFGRAGCGACHAVGADGDRVVGPNLGVGGDEGAPVAARARAGDDGPGYVAASIVFPDAVVVPGYAPGVMPAQDRPPVALTDDEIVALVAYLGGDQFDERAVRDRIVTARAARDRR